MQRSDDILNELNEISPVVAGLGRTNVFTVPQGYFDSIADTVLATVKDDVPQGYFDNLSSNILSKIEGTAAHELREISPYIAGLKKVTPYEVPENYFEQASFNAVIGVADDNLPLILNGLNKSQPFEVPVAYFSQLADKILSKIKEQPKVKLIAMPKRSNSIWKYAAAAVFTSMVTFGIYKYNNTIMPPTAVVTAMDETKFNESINNLSEEDIIKYLEKNGSDADVATLSSGIEETNLPDQEEYFTDETTLDKFLEDIELKN